MKTPANIDGYCEDCAKEILRGTVDAIPYFDSHRCAQCEAAMMTAMEFQPA